MADPPDRLADSLTGLPQQQGGLLIRPGQQRHSFANTGTSRLGLAHNVEHGLGTKRHDDKVKVEAPPPEIPPGLASDVSAMRDELDLMRQSTYFWG